MAQIRPDEATSGYFTGLKPEMGAVNEGQALMANGKVLAGPAKVSSDQTRDPTYAWKQEMKELGLDYTSEEDIDLFKDFKKQRDHDKTLPIAHLQPGSYEREPVAPEPNEPSSIGLSAPGPKLIPDACAMLTSFPDAHIIVSKTQPKGSAWGFKNAKTFIVNETEWVEHCQYAIDLINEMMGQEFILCPDLPSPMNDPEVGPLLSMLGPNGVMAMSSNDVPVIPSEEVAITATSESAKDDISPPL